MDTETGNIGAVEFTSSRQGDSPLLPDLLAQNKAPAKTAVPLAL